jgi:competence protein ComEC
MTPDGRTPDGLRLAFLALAWLLGVAAAAFSGAEPAAAVAAASLLGAATFAVRPRAGTLVVVAVGAALVAGATWRYEATTPTAAGTVAAYNGSDDDVRLRGVVDGEPDERATGRLYSVDVRTVWDGVRWAEAEGKVLVRTRLYPAYEYGDLIEIKGKLDEPPSFPEFDYRDYLLRQGVVSLAAYPDVLLVESGHGDALAGAVIDARQSLAGQLEHALPDPQASLASGVLLGTRSNLAPDLTEAMRATGTSHLVAVSGQNVALLAGLMIAACAWAIGRRPAAWLALATIAGYAVLVGGQASVVRATVMAAIYVMSIVLGRQSAAPVALALAAAVMTAHDPQVVHDVGFQMSFAATIGLITLGSEMRVRLEALAARWPAAARSPATAPLTETFAITSAAIAFTLPVTTLAFGQISVVALPANLLAVPAFAAVALTAALALAASALPGGEAAGWLAWLPATYMIGAIELMASLPAASVAIGGVSLWLAVPYYAALAASTWWLMERPVSVPQPPKVRERAGPRLANAVAAAAVAAVAGVLVWAAVATGDSGGRLAVTFLDVGQGEAILIEGPGGQRILVDGGPGGEVLSGALGRRLPFHDRRIDLVVVTHPQADHIGGLPQVLESYDVGAVLDSRFESGSPFYEALTEAADEAGVPRYVAARGQTIALGGGARVEVIGPVGEPGARADPNNASTVLRVAMGDVSFLLTGDIEADGEAALVRSGAELRATVLKVAHHGSKTSTAPAFLSRVAPAVGVISVGAANTFGHPTATVLSRLSGDYVLRTDEDGDVRMETEGERLWVTTER